MMLRDFMILCNDAGLCGQAWGAAVSIGYYIYSIYLFNILSL